MVTVERGENEKRARFAEKEGIYRTPKSDARCLGGSPLLSVPLWTQRGALRVFYPHRTAHPGRRRLSSRCYYRCLVRHWERYCVYFPKTRNTVAHKWRKSYDRSYWRRVFQESSKSVVIRTWQMYLQEGSWC